MNFRENGPVLNGVVFEKNKLFCRAKVGFHPFENVKGIGEKLDMAVVVDWKPGHVPDVSKLSDGTLFRVFKGLKNRGIVGEIGLQAVVNGNEASAHGVGRSRETRKQIHECAEGRDSDDEQHPDHFHG